MGSRPLMWRRSNIEDRKGWPIVVSAVICAKMDEPTEMPFGIWTLVGPRKHALDGVHIGTTWQIKLNHPCGSDMAVCQITLNTCFNRRFRCGSGQTSCIVCWWYITPQQAIMTSDILVEAEHRQRVNIQHVAYLLQLVSATQRRASAVQEGRPFLYRRWTTSKLHPHSARRLQIIAKQQQLQKRWPTICRKQCRRLNYVIFDT